MLPCLDGITSTSVQRKMDEIPVICLAKFSPPPQTTTQPRRHRRSNSYSLFSLPPSKVKLRGVKFIDPFKSCRAARARAVRSSSNTRESHRQPDPLPSPVQCPSLPAVGEEVGSDTGERQFTMQSREVPKGGREAEQVVAWGWIVVVDHFGINLKQKDS